MHVNSVKFIGKIGTESESLEGEIVMDTETETAEDLGNRGLLTGEPVDEVVAKNANSRFGECP